MPVMSLPEISSCPGERGICRCCGAPVDTVVANTDGGDYLRCYICGLESQIVATTLTDQFESAQSEFFGVTSVFLGSTLDRLYKERIVRRLKVIRKYLPGGRVLEVGPGAGFFLQALDESGYRVDAVEHSPALSDAIRARYGFRVWTGEFEKLDFDETLYDAYMSFHVLEHVPQVELHLRKAAAIVKQGGLAFIATPNAGSFEHKLLRRHSPNYSAAHLNLFTADSLSRLLSSCGWEMIDALTPSYTEAHLRVITSCIRAARRRDRRAKRGEYVSAVSGPRAERLIAVAQALSAPIRFIQGRVKRGNELLIVARLR